MNRSNLAALAIIATLSVPCACASPEMPAGKRVSGETLSMIAPGDSVDSVTNLLGEPTSRSENADGSEVWKWEYRQITRSSGAVLYVMGSTEDAESNGAVYAQLRDGRVVKSWRE